MATQQFTLQQLAFAALRFRNLSTATADIGSGGRSESDYLLAKDWANIVCQEIADFAPWPWLGKAFVEVTIPVGQYRVDLPADVHRLLTDPSYTDYAALFQPVGLQTVQDLRAASVSAGVPFVVALDYGTGANGIWHRLAVWPPADTDRKVNLAYCRQIPSMAADNDIPAMPDNLHRLVRAGTVAYAEREGERVAAGPFWQVFQKELAEAWIRTARDLGSSMALPLRGHNHTGFFGGAMPLGQNRRNIIITHP